jgi:hypothetical protein
MIENLTFNQWFGILFICSALISFIYTIIIFKRGKFRPFGWLGAFREISGRSLYVKEREEPILFDLAIILSIFTRTIFLILGIVMLFKIIE